ncbi:TPA: fimbrial biogenesis outer membrane usher protein [Escherichia coli]|nr:fimbrial biogenesis outer membrane usher protein [Escherichia coli]
MSYLNLRLYQRNTQCLHIRKHRLAGFFVRLVVACAFAAQAPLSSADLYFNPRFLADDPQAVADLSRFENGQELPPGTYRVDIYLNNGYMATRDVTFNTGDSEQGIVPCLTRAQLASMGLNTASVAGMNLLADDACVPLTTMVQDATAHLDVGQQRLNLTIPQAFMSNRARGYIPPELWDPGINAGLLNYNFSGNSVQNRIGGNSHYAYLNLQSGLNIGAWRLRDNTTWSYNSSDRSSGSKNKWQHINTWLERDIIPLRSRLTLGDGYTQGDIFDGINFRGAQLASDDNMLPDSQRGFAPVIHGIARGTAQVTIKQNGYDIYNSTVPPGPFTINDIYAAGNSGDLQVTIKEADGSTQIFTVPYSSVPLLQREGHTRYSITAGEYRSGNAQQEKPRFFQSTLLHGLPAGWTIYGGTYNKRGKLQLTVTQQLGRSSTLYLSGSHQTYWGTSNVDEQFQAGLNTAFEDINWTLSYSLTKNAWQKGRDQMLALNVNIPFSHWLRSDSKSQWRHASASYSMSHDLNGRMTNLAGVYGTLLEDNNLSYSVQTGYAGGGDGNSGSTGYATLNYRGGYGNANIGYSHSDDIKQLYYGVSGGVLAHANGVTLGQPLNDTVVLVKAPGAKDAKVENQTGVRTDWRGYAVLPYATEYRENRVALDTNTLADNVDLDNAVANVVPTRGAIVRAEFKARVGIKLLMTLTHNNKPLPFGAMVTSESSQSSGIVADNGQVYLSGMPLAGKVQVKWGEEENAHCVANYQLPPESQQQLLTQLSAECR